MSPRFRHESSVEEIRARFDADVERFSRLEGGQQATVDAPLVLELIAQAAATHLCPGDHLLDLGCGAGNFTLTSAPAIRLNLVAVFLVGATLFFVVERPFPPAPRREEHGRRG